MKKSKWDDKRLGHHRPIKDCRIPDQTHGEICLECNKCGRFNSIARRKKQMKKKYGIDYRRRQWSKGLFINNLFPRKWRHWGNYKTEKQRDQALKVLQDKKDYDMKIFEFRKSKPL